MDLTSPHHTHTTYRHWAGLVLAVALVFALGLPNIGKPSYWHDELVHVYVAKSVAEDAWPALPSGTFYPNGTVYHVLLAVPSMLFGTGEAAMRTPSVLLWAAAVIIAFLFVRRMAGPGTATACALVLALCPWTVAWSREARFYTLQPLLYVAWLWLTWHVVHAERTRNVWGATLGALAVFVAGMLTSFQLLLFLAPAGALAAWVWLWEPARRMRCVATLATLTGLGALTLLALWLNPNAADRSAVFQTGLGGDLVDPQRMIRGYYLMWLSWNLSRVYLAAALLGFALLLWKGGRQGLYLSLAFWVPVLMLTFLVGYRRPRFMFFAFPFYAAAIGYAIAHLSWWIAGFRRGWLGFVRALAALLLSLALARSGVLLIGDSIEVASGIDTTLARKHPKWRQPCQWVKEHATEMDAILTTTFLPVYHYLGRVDNWFPNRFTAWEVQESGIEGLADLDALRTWLAANPQGYFIADYALFGLYREDERLEQLRIEYDWVNTHMERVEDASNEDIAVYRWDFSTRETVPTRGIGGVDYTPFAKAGTDSTRRVQSTRSRSYLGTVPSLLSGEAP